MDRPTPPDTLPKTLAELRASPWKSKSVKNELRDNLICALESQSTDGTGTAAPLFPGIVGYDDSVIPEIVNGVLAGHDMLFLGEKGQAKSRLMRLLSRFLNEWTPYLDCPEAAVHEDPYAPITGAGKNFLALHTPQLTPIAWWHRSERYAERLAPGSKFADLIGEIDPAKILGGGASLNSEEALSFGIIPRLHRGIFAMNELPDLDDLVQTGLFNILEERDVQIRGYPVKFDIDVLVLFSANPSTYNRSGKVIPQLKDRIGSTIQTHYPIDRDLGIEITQAEALKGDQAEGDALAQRYPVLVPRFMSEIVEQMAIVARRSKYVDQASGVSARFSLANYRTMIASARRRAITLKGQGEPSPTVPRISDLAHFHASAVGKLELDLMGSHQMDESQVLDAILATAIGEVFAEYVDEHGLDEIAEIFGKGVKVEVGDTFPSAHYEQMLKRVPPAWAKAFEVNADENPAVRASCVEFVLAGLWATDRISRGERFGTVQYEV